MLHIQFFPLILWFTDRVKYIYWVKYNYENRVTTFAVDRQEEVSSFRDDIRFWCSNLYQKIETILTRVNGYLKTSLFFKTLIDKYQNVSKIKRPTKKTSKINFK